MIDYCAIDIKNSPDKYARTIGLPTVDFSPLRESVDCLLSLTGIFPYEFRTTVVKELHSSEDMYAIREWIANAAAYYLQSYTDSEQVITQGYHAAAITVYNYSMHAAQRNWWQVHGIPVSIPPDP